MTLSRRLLLSALPALAAPAVARAEEPFPSRPVRMIVPFPPGGTVDSLARRLGADLGGALRQPVVVDCRPGGSSLIGTDAVLKAPSDGHTVLFTNTSIVQLPILSRDAAYDPIRDFRPLVMVCRSPVILSVPAALGVSTLAEFLDYVRSHPDRTSYASSGHGSTGNVFGEELKRIARLDSVHVSYPGDSRVLIDLTTNRVQWYMGTPLSLAPSAKEGKLRLLAVTGTERLPLLPGVPTFTEAGMPGFEAVGWFGTFARADVPPERAAMLTARIADAVRHPGFADFLRTNMMGQGGAGGAEFGREVAAIQATWSRMIRENDIRID